MDLIVAGDRDDLVKARGTGRVALVPTMGALHEGHRSLIREARVRADQVVVSIFVNPLQFGPNEDFSRYPRTFDADLDVCRAEEVDVVFAPSADDMYHPDRQVSVCSGEMGTIVEGASRPGHFDGMLTVVLKLFNLVRPDLAIFGQKDAQQLAMIRRMVADLDVPVEIVGAPTVREPDGLALSSRNRYLSAGDRKVALALSRALRAGAAQLTPAAIRSTARAVLDAAGPGLDLDYLALVDPATFKEVGDSYAGTAVLAVAAKVGSTRLIDNVILSLRP
ncbi:MAG: pantoate--beta-alanine ligase [Nonomuraea sp.]|nr:pantoate--beta-alanine ligase [Nonomuraea sp.]NUP68405.1 pantoate--beta-alanine ligase [Nonomuraea sp.]NUP80892.1 pantoate--beta-alanine ligase [Nonomuraea sp.]NUS02443.1 pantoate--beta-alanine ligase [Nonomuraea sp.]NUT12398.1 pantoate--beta-alanine ligase [Nonomuraea sp.]